MDEKNRVALIRKHFFLDGEDVIRRRGGKPIRNKPHPTTGYIRVRVGPRPGTLMSLHMVKFVLLHGWIPEEVDHKNRDRADNSSANLRPATKQTNMWNAKRPPAPSGLPRGVKKLPYGRYSAMARHQGRYKHLGVFDTPEEASATYQGFCREHRGEYHYDG